MRVECKNLNVLGGPSLRKNASESDLSILKGLDGKRTYEINFNQNDISNRNYSQVLKYMGSDLKADLDKSLLRRIKSEPILEKKGPELIKLSLPESTQPLLKGVNMYCLNLKNSDKGVKINHLVNEISFRNRFQQNQFQQNQFQQNQSCLHDLSEKNLHQDPSNQPFQGAPDFQRSQTRSTGLAIAKTAFVAGLVLGVAYLAQRGLANHTEAEQAVEAAQRVYDSAWVDWNGQLAEAVKNAAEVASSWASYSPF